MSTMDEHEQDNLLVTLRQNAHTRRRLAAELAEAQAEGKDLLLLGYLNDVPVTMMAEAASMTREGVYNHLRKLVPREGVRV